MKKQLSHLLILSLLLSGSYTFAAPVVEEDYMAILLEGVKIGSAIHTRKVEGSKVTTIEEMNLLLGRGSSAINYSGKEICIESTSGNPIGFEIVQNISGMQQSRKGTINSGKVKTTIQNGPTVENLVVDYPAGALMSEGMRLLQNKKGLKPGTRYEAMLYRPDMDNALQATVEVGGKIPVDLFGRIMELSEVKVNMQVDQQVITVTTYVDADCRAHKSIVPMMGMKLELIACDKAFALGRDNVVDFLEKLSVASPTAIPQSAKDGPIQYELVATTDKPLILPETDTQSVKEIAPGRFLVSVTPIKAPEAVKYPYDGKDNKIRKLLESTEYLQAKDPKVKEMVKYAITSPDDAAKAISQIENFVKGYITKKDLSVGYASAAEVAQMRQGDCSEHAVLAATMCRAAGIPARVVCGIVYVEALGTQKNVFGGHMWAEAYIGDKWIPIDPTRAPNGFSASHITLARGDGQPTDFFSMINTLGCFKIEKVILPGQPAPVEKVPELQVK